MPLPFANIGDDGPRSFFGIERVGHRPGDEPNILLYPVGQDIALNLSCRSM